MLHRSRTHLLTPLLALSAVVAAVGPLHAQYRYETRTTTTTTSDGTFHVRFSTTPRWTEVTGRGVAMVELGDRPSYDMFRFNNRYYVYRDGRWYTSTNWSGTFRTVDIRNVPVEISYVPRDHWVSYPVAWQRDDWDDRDRTWNVRPTADGTFQVRFSSTPRWIEVSRGVGMVEVRNRPSYDMFRYGNRYYVYRDGRWYTSTTWSGTFHAIDMRNVPMEISYVPRQHWVSYPVAWRSSERHPDWNDREWRAPDEDVSGTIKMSWRGRPRWSTVPGSRVMVVNRVQMPDYDVFRYGNTYFVYSDGQWYSARNWNATFMAIDDRAVPRALYQVPRRYWRTEPPDWNYSQRDRRY